MTKRTFTDEILDDRMAECLRRKSPTERLAMCFAMWRFARQLVLAGVRQQHPDWSENDCEREVARRMSHGAV